MPKSFNPQTDIPSLQGKVILITGGNVGLGKQAALNLAKHNPEEIWIAARNTDKAANAIAEIQRHVPKARLRSLKLDLASLASVQSAARDFTSAGSRLDILMLNAGVMALPAGQTKDGYEIQFGTNHVGHALLVKLLLPLLQNTAATPGSDVRVVAVSSMGHKYVPSGGIQFDTLKTPAESMATTERYGSSKLANILHMRALARRHPELTTASVHPGVVKTDLHNTGDGSWMVCMFTKMAVPLIGVTVEEGAKNQTWAATAKKGEVVSGEYYTPVGNKGNGSKLASDDGLADKLWRWTEKELEGWNL